MRPAAVIGSQGFIGRALVRALRRAGAPVAEFTRSTPFSPGDVPEAGTVYYLANSINPAIAERHPDLAEADLRLFDEFLACLPACAELPVVVLPSSGGTVYDPAAPPPYTESSPTAPATRYGSTKLEMERRLLAAARSGACRPAILRVSNVYGPGQRAGTGQGVVAHWLAAAASGEPIVVYGDPATSRDYVYVDDVAAAMTALLDPPAELPPVVNIGSGVPTTLETLAELIRDVCGDVETKYEGDRGFDVARTWLDVTRARDALGWSAATSLREGIERAWTAVVTARGGAAER